MPGSSQRISLWWQGGGTISDDGGDSDSHPSQCCQVQYTTISDEGGDRDSHPSQCCQVLYTTICKYGLEGTVQQNFPSSLFHKSNQPLTNRIKYFRFWLKIHRVILTLSLKI